jgi:hypothetical protein
MACRRVPHFQPGRKQAFLNQRKFDFQDITAQAGVAGTKAWSTGVTFADVNGDGWLDIYVCNAGMGSSTGRKNELFLNNGKDAGGKVTFTEKADAYGLADMGFSTHAAFLTTTATATSTPTCLTTASCPSTASRTSTSATSGTTRAATNSSATTATHLPT